MTTVTQPGAKTLLGTLATGSNCPRCGATTDEPCRTPRGAETQPHTARIDRAVRQYQAAK